MQGGAAGKPQPEYAALAASAPDARPAAGADAGCVIFTTSGTTRAPKFVLHDQRTVLRHAHVIGRRAINIESPIDEVRRMLINAQKSIRQRTDLEPVSSHPNIAAWREAYRAFGAKSSEYPSSIEALVKRVRRGDASISPDAGLPYINTLAAICNSVSLRYLVPIGGHSIDVMSPAGELRLGFARVDEEFAPFGGGPLEHPIAGEVIFTYNTATVLCRRWTWRQGEFSKLQRTTTAVVINVDGLPPVTRADVELICNDLATLAGLYCGNAPAELKMLSEDQPVAEI